MSDARLLMALGMPDKLDLLQRLFRRTLVQPRAAGRFLGPVAIETALTAAGEQGP